MIIGLGCDIVNIERLQQSTDFVERFIHRILGPNELNEWKKRNFLSTKEQLSALAKYYAGKEAFAKALGTGFRDGIFLKDIQILHDTNGKPQIKISAQAEKYLQKITSTYSIHVSLSDDYPYAQAVVIIEK